MIIGERPAWEIGASAPVRLSFKKKKQETNTAVETAVNRRSSNGSNGVSNGNGQKTWRLIMDDDSTEDGTGMKDDLVDEDALLEASAPVVKRVTESVSCMCVSCVCVFTSSPVTWREKKKLEV